MSENDVNLVISDLRTDAEHWDLISAALNDGLKIMQDSCTLPYATFDGITHALGATGNYEATYDQMTTLLSGGVTETASIATRLRATADNMVATDEAATQRP